jgi:hypothetical protein
MLRGEMIMDQERRKEAENRRGLASAGLNVLVAAEPSEKLSRRAEITGEYVLIDAMLREAIREYQKFAGYKSRRGARLFHQVEQWFSTDDRDWCFSFLNACRILDLEPTYIRTGLKMWRERALSTSTSDT